MTNSRLYVACYHNIENYGFVVKGQQCCPFCIRHLMEFSCRLLRNAGEVLLYLLQKDFAGFGEAIIFLPNKI